MMPPLQRLLDFFPEDWGSILTTLPNLTLEYSCTSTLPPTAGLLRHVMWRHLTLSVMATMIRTKKMKYVRHVIPMGKRYATGFW